MNAPLVFRCISCGAALLEVDRQNIICPACERKYPVEKGIPVILPEPTQLKVVADADAREMTLEQCQDIYDKVYSYDGLMGTDLDEEYDRITKQTLLEFGGDLTSKRLLDVGAGVGNLWTYTPPGVQGYALDISLTGMARVAARFPDLTVSVSVGEFLPYPEHFFDVVIAADTIEHTFSPKLTLQEIHRVLRPQGILGASFPIPDSLRKWGYNRFLRQSLDVRLLYRLARVLIKRTLLFGRPDFQPIDRDRSPNEWVDMLRQVGFHVETVIKWPPAPQLPIVTLVKAKRG